MSIVLMKAFSSSAVQQALRRHLHVGIANERGDEAPRGPAVDPHADPAARTDVRRDEKALRIGRDEVLLSTERRRQPDGEPIRAVMMVVERGEHLAADTPGGFA